MPSQVPNASPMELADLVLYHQIHAVKLLTDVLAAIAAAILLWNHRLWGLRVPE